MIILSIVLDMQKLKKLRTCFKNSVESLVYPVLVGKTQPFYKKGCKLRITSTPGKLLKHALIQVDFLVLQVVLILIKTAD